MSYYGRWYFSGELFVPKSGAQSEPLMVPHVAESPAEATVPSPTTGETVMERKPDYVICGYAANGHPAFPHISEGDLLVKTWHVGESSRDMEIAAWKERMKRGEVSYITVTDTRTNETETISAAEG